MRSILSLSEGQFHSLSGEYNGGALPSGVRLSAGHFYFAGVLLWPGSKIGLSFFARMY
jgi:hypothetical protein